MLVKKIKLNIGFQEYDILPLMPLKLSRLARHFRQHKIVIIAVKTAVILMHIKTD